MRRPWSRCSPAPSCRRRLRPETAEKPGFVRRAASARVPRRVVSVAKGCWSCAATLVGHCRDEGDRGRLGGAGGPGGGAWSRVRRGMTAFARQVWLGWFVAAGMVRRFRKPLLVAVAGGTTLGVVCYLAGPTVSSLVNGVAGFLGSLAAGGLARLRRPSAATTWPSGATGAGSRPSWQSGARPAAGRGSGSWSRPPDGRPAFLALATRRTGRVGRLLLPRRTDRPRAHRQLRGGSLR